MPKISPSGEYIAWVVNDMGQYRITLYDVKTKKTKKIIKKEYKLDQITDYSFPLIAWHPSGKILSYIIERKGKILLNLYNLETKKTEVIQMFNFEKILDFSYSDDGLKLVMSAYNKGYSDIYIHNLAAHTNKQITNDFADDLNPRFINNSEDIIFSSNRNKSQINSKLGVDIELNTSHDIFIYNVKSNNKELTRLTKTPYIDETNPFSIKENIYSFLSNQNGII